MILRSGKVLIKDDFISRLPDELLIRILSLLPETDANRTCILAKRWRHLWAFLPNLSISVPYRFSGIRKLSIFNPTVDQNSNGNVDEFYDYVDQILAIRKGMPIQRFKFCCFYNCKYRRVYNVISSAVQCKIQELDLTFPDDICRVKFCWDLFRTFNTLVRLKLNGKFVLDVPEDELLFPCLKEIYLLSISYAGDKALSNLISGSPVLETLSVLRPDYRWDNLQKLNISSKSLKRLSFTFTWYHPGDYKVVIEAPKLEYIEVMDTMSTDYFLREPLSLVDAHINETRSIAQLVTFLSSTKILTLSHSALAGLSHVPGLNIPVFPHLVKLVIGIDCLCGWNFLPILLNNMPNLEHITFTDWLRVLCLVNMSWNPPADPPTCVRFKIKEITIDHQEAVTLEEFTFIKYLLKHSTNLVTFMISSRNLDLEMCGQTLSYLRDSNLCRVEFF